MYQKNFSLIQGFSSFLPSAVYFDGNQQLANLFILLSKLPHFQLVNLISYLCKQFKILFSLYPNLKFHLLYMSFLSVNLQSYVCTAYYPCNQLTKSLPTYQTLWKWATVQGNIREVSPVYYPIGQPPPLTFIGQSSLFLSAHTQYKHHPIRDAYNLKSKQFLLIRPDPPPPVRFEKF